MSSTRKNQKSKRLRENIGTNENYYSERVLVFIAHQSSLKNNDILSANICKQSLHKKYGQKPEILLKNIHRRYLKMARNMSHDNMCFKHDGIVVRLNDKERIQIRSTDRISVDL